MDGDGEWLTSEEVARHLRLSVRTIHDWRQMQSGPVAYKVGRRLLWRRDEVDAWVHDQVASPPLGKTALAAAESR